jgi:hypothetical protein
VFPLSVASPPIVSVREFEVEPVTQIAFLLAAVPPLIVPPVIVMFPGFAALLTSIALVVEVIVPSLMLRAAPPV